MTELESTITKKVFKTEKESSTVWLITIILMILKSINDNHTDDDNYIKFYLNLPHMGRAGEMLVKKCIRKLKKKMSKICKSYICSNL